MYAMVTTATQTNRDPNRDKILARFNPPRTTSETYRRQDDVFGYELQFLLSGMLSSVFQNLDYKLQRRLSVLPIQQSYQKCYETFSSSRRVTRRQAIVIKTDYRVIFVNWLLPCGVIRRIVSLPQCRKSSSNLLKIISLSKATSIDSDCCRLPTARVLSNKAEKSRSNHF